MSSIKPQTDSDIERGLRQARKTNGERDYIDTQNGAAMPGDKPLHGVFTAKQAILAGLKTGDVVCIYEGIDMLETAENQLRSAN